MTGRRPKPSVSELARVGWAMVGEGETEAGHGDLTPQSALS